MGRIAGLLAAAALLALCDPRSSVAQAPLQATSTVAVELPPDVKDQLDSIEDGTLSFDVPGFYALVHFVRTAPHAPGWQTPAILVSWRDLLERPRSFRGVPVTVMGKVGRNKDPYTLPRHPELGELTQLELLNPGEPLSCTLILTQPAADITIGADVTATGYFVMIRGFLDGTGHTQYAALVVAPGPTAISAPANRRTESLRYVWGFASAAVVGLLLAWFLLRRVGRRGRTNLAALSARQAAPTSVADDLARWAEHPDADQPGDKDDPPR